jgi:uncharacterized membrane protein (DUF2068 family)
MVCDGRNPPGSILHFGAMKSASTHPDRTAAPQPHRNRGLALIAIFKFAKATLLITVGFGALRLIHSDLMDQAKALFDSLGQSLDVVPVLKLLRQIGALAPNSLRLVGAGSFLYAVLFLTEGIGLWRQRRWAEYLTVVATASFIPFEIFEITRRLTWPRVSAFVINVAVLIYVIWVLRVQAREAEAWAAEREASASS